MLIKYWELHHPKPLRYIGDGYNREIVKPVQKIDNIERLQIFMWPDGQKHAVPFHTVIEDSESLRYNLNLEP